MGTLTVTGSDTLVLNGTVMADLATDDTTKITFPNELVNIKTGKNGNSIVALNQQGYNGLLNLKLMRGSSDDQMLTNILAAMTADFVSTPLIAGSFTKRMGINGNGTVINDVYNVAGGTISKIPEATENVSGSIEQAETTWIIKFTNCTRSIE